MTAASLDSHRARATRAGGQMTRKELIRRARLPRLGKAITRQGAAGESEGQG